ncbi:hypothetical protein TNCV_4944301 [Trichonephila clavipes]|nr:hypothetical protein TNCV_4944301 [Trichonephila clavipes]
MNGNRGDINHALIGSNAGNPFCLGGYTNPFERDTLPELNDALMSEWIVDKRHTEACNSRCPKCLHKRRSYTINAYTVQCQYRRAISSTPCIISNAPAADRR